MEDIVFKFLSGVFAFLLATFGWLFKGTAKKADDAVSLSNELNKRVEKLEVTQTEFHEMAINLGKVETKVENIQGTLKRIETYLLEERKR